MLDSLVAAVDNKVRYTRHHSEDVTRHALMMAESLDIPDEASVRRAIISHHEHWDGTGFPAGLRGLDIPQLGRILAVADADWAMTSDRPYRKALTQEQALDEIRRGSGRQFDPQIVGALLHTYDGDEQDGSGRARDDARRDAAGESVGVSTGDGLV
jgi:HD-GYP domain-containing protein (c-di-GMP phosphodiesterase class II)